MPRPYYEHAGITIFHGDCREVLPTINSVDLVLTDPPYGLGEARGKNRSRTNLRVRAVPKDYGVSAWDDAPPRRWIFDWLMDMSRQQIIWGGNFFGLPASSCWLVWDKDNGASDFADCELAWTNFDKAVRKLTYRWNGMLQEPGRPKEDRWHPTQKPEAVIRWALGHATSVASVLDPFMGSGTTLRVCKDAGLTAIGIEAEERYCEIAAKRLSQEVFAFDG